ncbi:MAG: cbb3-type cytochrome c oxidase subunit I [Planctomycetota bacterium]
MSETCPSPDSRGSGAPVVRRLLGGREGDVVALRFLGLGVLPALAGAVLSMLVRAQLTWPETGVVAPETYTSLVTVHGVFMVFGFVFPVLFSAIPALVGNLVPGEPRQQSRLWFVSFGLFAVSAFGSISLIFFGSEGAASGWLGSVPLATFRSAAAGSGAAQDVLSAVLVGLSLSGLVSVIAFFRDLRQWPHRVPFEWHTLSAALGVVGLGFFAFGSAHVLLLLERAEIVSVLSPPEASVAGVFASGGGDPALFASLVGAAQRAFVLAVYLAAVAVSFGVGSWRAAEAEGGRAWDALLLLALIDALLSLVAAALHQLDGIHWLSLGLAALRAALVVSLLVLPIWAWCRLRSGLQSPAGLYAGAALAFVVLSFVAEIVLYVLPVLRGTPVATASFHLLYAGAGWMTICSVLSRLWAFRFRAPIERRLTLGHVAMTLVGVLVFAVLFGVLGSHGHARYDFDGSVPALDISLSVVAVFLAVSQLFVPVNFAWSLIKSKG